MLQEQQYEDDMFIREPLRNETVGEKNKRLLLKLCKKWWFWVILGSIVSLLVGAVGSEIVPDVEYDSIELEKLFDDLNSNPYRAEKIYQDKYIEFEGQIVEIKSEFLGVYIDVRPLPGDFWEEIFSSSSTIRCHFDDEATQGNLMTKKEGSMVIIKGKITDVDEYGGYELEIHELH